MMVPSWTKRVGLRFAVAASMLPLLVIGPPASPASAAVTPIVVIVMENHSYGATDQTVRGDTTKYIVGNPDAPYINNTLIPQGELFTSYLATAHPSLPDYLEMTAGTAAGCSVDTCARDAFSNDNLFHQLGQAGISFATYAQSMPSNCNLSNNSPYVVHHNPEVYFTNVDAASGLSFWCPTSDVAFPSTWPNPLPAFSYVVPDICNDMHGTPATGICPGHNDQIITAGDTWLSQSVPTFLSRGATVVVTFDEGAAGDMAGGGGHVLTLVVGSHVQAGTTDPTPYTHDSLLAGLERSFSLGFLGAAATAAPLPMPMGGGSSGAPTITGFSPIHGTNGTTVMINGSNFTGASSVVFNGTTATFSVSDASTILATVPAGATSGPIGVTNSAGTATSGSPFTLDPSSTGGPALVQHVAASGSSGQSPSATWATTTKGGNLLLASLAWSGTATPQLPAGWTLAIKGPGVAIFFIEDATSHSGAVAFTGGSFGSWGLELMEWTGAAPTGVLDATASASSGSAASTTATSGTTAPTTQAQEIAIGSIFALRRVTMTKPTNGFTEMDTTGHGQTEFGTYSKMLTSTGPQDVAVSLNGSAPWRGVLATFRAA